MIPLWEHQTYINVGKDVDIIMQASIVPHSETPSKPYSLGSRWATRQLVDIMAGLGR
jgi:hypothetical protein